MANSWSMFWLSPLLCRFIECIPFTRVFEFGTIYRTLQVIMTDTIEQRISRLEQDTTSAKVRLELIERDLKRGCVKVSTTYGCDSTRRLLCRLSIRSPMLRTHPIFRHPWQSCSLRILHCCAPCLDSQRRICYSCQVYEGWTKDVPLPPACWWVSEGVNESRSN